MNTLIRTALVLASPLAFAASASAAGAYIRADAMFNHPQDVETNSLTNFRSSLDSNVGYSGAIGYRISRLRLEVELQRFKNNAAQGFDNNGATTTSGSFSQFSGFANVFADFPLVGPIGGYAGGGLGFARVNFDNFSASQGASSIVTYSGSDSAFAYQVAAGAQLVLGGNASLHAGYRIVKQGNVRIRDTLSAAEQTVKLGDNKLFEIGVTIGF